MNEERIKGKSLEIYNGLLLVRKRLLESKAKNDGEIVISRDGKIIRVKAKELLKKSP